MKGRKKLPTALKEVQGTLRKCRVNPNEPDYCLIKEIPDPPEFLSEYGKKIYYDTADELLKIGTLTRIAFPVFVMYCIEIAKYFDASQQLEKFGKVYKDQSSNPKINPYHKIASDSLAAAVRIACEFGITPASASKVSANSNTSTTDPKMKLLEKMMNG